MTADPRPLPVRLWRPAGLSAGGPGLLNHRLRLAQVVASVVGLFCFFCLLPVLLAARFIFHLPVPANAFVGVLVTTFATRATVHALQLWGLFLSGRWKALDGQMRLRADHPRNFWAVATAQALIAVVWFAVVGFLTWSLLL